MTILTLTHKSSALILEHVMISGQEPHQPDVDSEPRQEDPGGGGAQASLDLPEGEGGLCVPQVSSIIFLFWKVFMLHICMVDTIFISDKRLWIAWRNSMQEGSWRGQSWPQCLCQGTSQVSDSSFINIDKFFNQS